MQGLPENPYRSISKVVESAATLEGKLRALQTAVIEFNINVPSLEMDGDDLINEIIDEIRALHVDLIQDRIEARFRKIEDKIR